MPFYWGVPDTSITFCEDKYAQSVWIAEYHNTLSALFYIAMGSLFLNTRVSPLAMSLIFVGCGTACLHMTDRAYGQMIDEIGMLILSFHALTYIRKCSPYTLAPILVLYVVLHAYFVFFVLVFGCMQLYIAKRGWANAARRQRVLILRYVIFFVVGTVCWILDRWACSTVQMLQMHAWWHFFTSLAIGSGLMALTIDGADGAGVARV